MDAIECIKGRMSIRKFRSEPVPKELLLEVIEAAQRSPSYKNSQPWEISIVSGKMKEALSKRLVDLFQSGAEPQPDMGSPAGWPEEIESRINDMLSKRGKAFGLDLESPDIQKKSKIANFNFYGAPHGIFLFQDGSLNEWSILDMGMFAQALMLAAHAKGLGTVPQAFLTDYAGEVKKFLGLPDSKRLVLGISIGYPQSGDRANSYRTERIEPYEMVRWVE